MEYFITHEGGVITVVEKAATKRIFSVFASSKPVKISTGNSTERPLGRPRRRWEDNIRMDLKEKGTNTRNWVDSAQDRDYWRALLNAAFNLRVP